MPRTALKNFHKEDSSLLFSDSFPDCMASIFRSAITLAICPMLKILTTISTNENTA